jgi:hypothetical protein
MNMVGEICIGILVIALISCQVKEKNRPSSEQLEKSVLYEHYAFCSMKSDSNLELEFNPLRIDLKIETFYYEDNLNSTAFVFEVYENLNIEKLIRTLGCYIYHTVYIDLQRDIG